MAEGEQLSVQVYPGPVTNWFNSGEDSITKDPADQG